MKVLFFSKNFGAATTTFIRNEVDYLLEIASFKYLCQEVDEVHKHAPYVSVIPFNENKVIKKIRWILWQNDWLCNFHNYSYAGQVNKLISEFAPDIIHCHFAYEALTLLDNIDKRKHHIVVHFHGYDASQMTKKKSYLSKLKNLFTYENVHFISCNDFFVQSLSGKLAIPPSRFHVLRYGIDISLFQPVQLPMSKAKITFLQISSLAEKKGHEYTLEAFASFLNMVEDKSKYELVIAGSGKRREKLESIVKKLQIDIYVHFAGLVTPRQAVELMKEADVFLHHSVTASNGDMEGIPNAIIEAMAMELPIISTWHSGIPELVEDGVNGFLVQEKDTADYAKKMLLALRMGKLKVNRDKVEEFYNLKKHNEQLARIYKNILSSKSNSKV